MAFFSLPADVRGTIWRRKRFVEAQEHLRIWHPQQSKPTVEQTDSCPAYTMHVHLLTARRKILVISVWTVDSGYVKEHSRWKEVRAQAPDALQMAVETQTYDAGVKVRLLVQDERVCFIYSSTYRDAYISKYTDGGRLIFQHDPFWSFWKGCGRR